MSAWTKKATPQNGDQNTRRRFLRLAGLGLGLGLGGLAPSKAQCAESTRILKRGDRIDVGDDAKAIIEKAYELGHEYEKKYGGCAQCAVAALQDAVPFVSVDVGLFRGASCLDGGATPVNIQNCGGFTGAAMVIGFLCGRTRDKKFRGSTRLSHDLSHKLYERFKEHYETVLCRDVRKTVKGDCPLVVGRAAKWTAEILLREFTDYE